MLPESTQQFIFLYWDIAAVIALFVFIFTGTKNTGNGIAALNDILRTVFYPKYLDFADMLTWILPVVVCMFLMIHIGVVHSGSCSCGVKEVQNAK